MADATGKIVIEAKDNASGTLNNIKGNSDKLSDSFKKIGAGMTAFGVAGAGAIMGLAGAAGKMESLQIAMKTSFQGNEEAAKSAMDTITKFSKETPYQLEEVTQGFLKLKNMGLDPSVEALTSYGNTASSMGKGLNDMVEAVADAATGEFERLKEFGIKSRVEGDKVKFTFQGVTTEVGNNSQAIQDYLLAIGNTQFAGGMEAQSKTLLGIWSSFKDEMFLLAVQLGEPFKKPLKDLMEDIMKVANKVKEFVQHNPEIAEMAAKVLLVSTAFTLIAGPILVFIGFIPSIVEGFVAIGIAAKATWAAMTGPIGIVIISIGLLVTALLWLWENSNFVATYIQESWDVFKQFFIDLWQTVTDWIKLKWAEIKEYVTTVASGLAESIKGWFNGMYENAKTAFQPFIDWWSNAWDIVKNALGGAWDWITGKVKGAVDSVLGIVQGLIDKIMALIDLLPFVDSAKAKVTNSPAPRSAPKRASGGSVLSGTPYLVGERGPEMFVPSQGGNIVPNGRTSSGITINIYGNVSSKEIAEEYGNVLIQKLKLHSAVV